MPSPVPYHYAGERAGGKTPVVYPSTVQTVYMQSDRCDYDFRLAVNYYENCGSIDIG